MGEQSQESKHGDATKIDGICSLSLPIVSSDAVVLMIFVGQGQPDVQIGEVNHGASSSSKMREISEFLIAGMMAPLARRAIGRGLRLLTDSSGCAGGSRNPALTKISSRSLSLSPRRADSALSSRDS